MVTYCAGGEFKHADERGKGGVLKKGWVQHSTIGTGMDHSEINNRPDKSMRFIQMWFYPERLGLEPSVEQKKVDKSERKNKFLPIVSNKHENALPIRSDAIICSSFLEENFSLSYQIQDDWGIYLYVLEGGPIILDETRIEKFSAVKVKEEKSISVKALSESELLLVETYLKAPYINQ